jgi:hypothetical protein
MSIYIIINVINQIFIILDKKIHYKDFILKYRFIGYSNQENGFNYKYIN